MAGSSGMNTPMMRRARPTRKRLNPSGERKGYLKVHEEYARAGAPGRLNHMGETLFGPTCIAFGTPAQKQRFLPKVVAGEEIWCQGYSEPNAGSDLANVQTRARLEGGEWVVDGQKVWTSWASFSDWCFVVC